MEELKKEGEIKSFRVVKGIQNISKVQHEESPRFIWKGIPEGSKGIITGVAKTGKTTFAENLAISLSVGKKDFFGESTIGEPQRVLYVNLEESYRLFARRNMKQISVLSEQERRLFEKNYISIPDGFPSFLNKDEDWNILRQYIIDSNADIVFIDSLSHMLVGEIEKSVVAQKFVQTINEYIFSLNCTFIIIHHNTKGNDKPITQDNIAGSRFILQEFEFAIGLANIPTSHGGNYLCMLYNKHIPKDDVTALLYSVNTNGWVEYLGKQNKFELYTEVKSIRLDGRVDTTNKDLLYDYFSSLSSLDSMTITSKQLFDEFVSTNTMVKDTLYKNIDKLLEEEKIIKLKKGEYKLKQKGDDEGRIGEE